jgi:hypothetical protein
MPGCRPSATRAIRPGSPVGVFICVVAVGAALSMLIHQTQPWVGPQTVLFGGIAYALPVGVLAARGHFGDASWDLPTPGALCMIFWLFGITPSVLGFGPGTSIVVNYASPEAIWVGRVVAWCWFALFAIGLGRNEPRTGAERRDGLSNTTLVLSLAAIVPLWLVAVLVTRDADMISRWGARASVPIGGWRFGFVLLFNELTPAMVPLCGLILARGGRRARGFGGVLICAVLAVLFAMSSRRLWVIAMALTAIVARRCLPRLRWRWLLVAAALVYVGVGPAQWAYRTAIMRQGLGDEVAVAVESVATYATDPHVRRRSQELSSKNLEQRFDSAAPFYAVIGYVMDQGPNLSPSMLTGIVRSVPSMLWPDKNRAANSLEIERQVHRIREIAIVDLGINPITEFVFQLGPILGLVGGLLYGLLGRALNRSLRPALDDPSRLVLWCMLATAMFYFDSGTEILFGTAREALALFVVARIVRRALLGPGAQLEPDRRPAPRSLTLADNGRACSRSKAAGGDPSRRASPPSPRSGSPTTRLPAPPA